MNTRKFVESLKRLYLTSKVALNQIKSYLSNGKITAEEYDYITGEIPSQA